MKTLEERREQNRVYEAARRAAGAMWGWGVSGITRIVVVWVLYTWSLANE